MFNDFINEFKNTLSELGVDDTETYVNDYTARYNVLRASGKSEFESVLALGDPVANARAIAGCTYTADEQIANNLLSEFNDASSANTVLSDNINTNKSNETDGVIETCKPFSTGEKTFYAILLFIAACLTIAFAFVTALIGIISIGYLFLAWFDFSGINKVIVFVFAIVGVFLFTIFAAITALISYKMYRFTTENLIRKNNTNAIKN